LRNSFREKVEQRTPGPGTATSKALQVGTTQKAHLHMQIKPSNRRTRL